MLITVLTRETALARLRATGKLSNEPNPVDVIPAGDVNQSSAIAISKIVGANVGLRKRCLAPSINHAALP